MEKITISASLQEELSHIPLKVEGNIPSWLSGTLIRNGPIDVFVNGKTNAHWFDGLAMLHGFSFDQGRVSYSNKFLRTDAYKKVFCEGSLNYEGFAIDPCRSLFKRLFTFFFPSTCESLPNANINVGKLMEQCVAYTEIPLPVKFDKETLETLGAFSYNDQLPHNRCWESAHPHYDLLQKETINYLIEYGRKSYYVIYRILDNSSERQVIARIPVKNPSYMHSFSVTKNYILLTEYPFLVRPLEMALGNQAFIKNFVWHENDNTYFLVIERNTGNIKGRYPTKPFFAFHHANAFEDKGRLFADIITYKDVEIISAIGDETRENSSLNEKVKDYDLRLERFELNFDTGEITHKSIFDRIVEFPRINSLKEGVSYQYLYAIDPREGGTRSIYKINVNSLEFISWSEEGCQPGEAIFIPAPPTVDEDDGVILAVIFNSFKKQSFLIALEAKSFKEIGRAIVPHVIPPGLHGQFISN